MIALVAILLTADSVLALTSSSNLANCGLYHTPPCYYIPSPPGQSPHCARPGNTYCEHIDNYPTTLINHLVHKWAYDGRYLFVDESQNDFSSLWPVQAVHANPYNYPPADLQSQRAFYSGYNYAKPNKYIERSYSILTNSPKDLSSSEQFLPQYYQYTSINQKSNNPRKHFRNQSNFNFTLINQQNYTINNNKMWSTIVENVKSDFGIASKRSANGATFDQNLNRNVSLRIPFQEIIHSLSHKPQHLKDYNRPKRQSLGRSGLCPSTTRYIAPQAALNSKGNWMFIINEGNIARQVVKAELCSTDTCTNICQLPNGYNSRCEQKYIQKRLIALQGNGQNLYMDTFWFPSCCLCTISAN